MQPQMRFILRDEQIRENALRYLGALNLAQECTLQVEIKPHKRNRSLAQNRIYWRFTTTIGEALGYRKDEQHRIFKGLYLLPILARDDEQVARVERAIGGDPEGTDAMIDLLTTTDLSVKQFAEYLADVEHFADEAGIRLDKEDDDYLEAMGRRRA